MENTVDFNVLKDKIIKTDHVINMYVNLKKKYDNFKNDLEVNTKKYKQIMSDYSILQLENERLSHQFEEHKREMDLIRRTNETLEKKYVTLESEYGDQSNELHQLQYKYQTTCGELLDCQNSLKNYQIISENQSPTIQETPKKLKKSKHDGSKNFSITLSDGSQFDVEYDSDKGHSEHETCDNPKKEQKIYEINLDDLKSEINHLSNLNSILQKKLEDALEKEKQNHQDHQKKLNIIESSWLEKEHKLLKEITELKEKLKLYEEDDDSSQIINDYTSGCSTETGVLSRGIDCNEKLNPIENGFEVCEEENCPQKSSHGTERKSCVAKCDLYDVNHDVHDIFIEMRTERLLSPMPLTEDDIIDDPPDDDCPDILQRQSPLRVDTNGNSSGIIALNDDFVPKVNDRYENSRKLKTKRFQNLLKIKKAKHLLWIKRSRAMLDHEKRLGSMKKIPMCCICYGFGKCSCYLKNNLADKVIEIFQSIASQKMKYNRRKNKLLKMPMDNSQGKLELNKMLLEKARKERQTLSNSEVSSKSSNHRNINNVSHNTSSEQILSESSLETEISSSETECTKFDSCYESQMSNPPSIEMFKHDNLREYVSSRQVVIHEWQNRVENKVDIEVSMNRDIEVNRCRQEEKNIKYIDQKSEEDKVHKNIEILPRPNTIERKDVTKNKCDLDSEMEKQIPGNSENYNVHIKDKTESIDFPKEKNTDERQYVSLHEKSDSKLKEKGNSLATLERIETICETIRTTPCSPADQIVLFEKQNTRETGKFEIDSHCRNKNSFVSEKLDCDEISEFSPQHDETDNMFRHEEEKINDVSPLKSMDLIIKHKSETCIGPECSEISHNGDVAGITDDMERIVEKHISIDRQRNDYNKPIETQTGKSMSNEQYDSDLSISDFCESKMNIANPVDTRDHVNCLKISEIKVQECEASYPSYQSCGINQTLIQTILRDDIFPHKEKGDNLQYSQKEVENVNCDGELGIEVSEPKLINSLGIVDELSEFKGQKNVGIFQKSIEDEDCVFGIDEEEIERSNQHFITRTDISLRTYGREVSKPLNSLSRKNHSLIDMNNFKESCTSERDINLEGNCTLCPNVRNTNNFNEVVEQKLNLYSDSVEQMWYNFAKYDFHDIRISKSICESKYSQELETKSLGDLFRNYSNCPVSSNPHSIYQLGKSTVDEVSAEGEEYVLNKVEKPRIEITSSDRKQVRDRVPTESASQNNCCFSPSQSVLDQQREYSSSLESIVNSTEIEDEVKHTYNLRTKSERKSSSPVETAKKCKSRSEAPVKFRSTSDMNEKLVNQNKRKSSDKTSMKPIKRRGILMRKAMQTYKSKSFLKDDSENLNLLESSNGKCKENEYSIILENKPLESSGMQLNENVYNKDVSEHYRSSFSFAKNNVRSNSPNSELDSVTQKEESTLQNMHIPGVISNKTGSYFLKNDTRFTNYDLCCLPSTMNKDDMRISPKLLSDEEKISESIRMEKKGIRLDENNHQTDCSKRDTLNDYSDPVPQKKARISHMIKSSELAGSFRLKKNYINDSTSRDEKKEFLKISPKLRSQTNKSMKLLQRQEKRLTGLKKKSETNINSPSPQFSVSNEFDDSDEENAHLSIPHGTENTIARYYSYDISTRLSQVHSDSSQKIRPQLPYQNTKSTKLLIPKAPDLKIGGFKQPNRTKIIPPCPSSPPPSDSCDLHEQPVIIPTEKIQEMEHNKALSLLRKLITYSTEENTVQEVANHFVKQESEYTAKLILEQILLDTGKPNKTESHVPCMTETQKVMLGFMMKLGNMNMKDLTSVCLRKSEQHLLYAQNLQEVDAVTRFYLAVCKSHGYIEKMRRMCCDAFYFMGDLAVPFLFIILTSWIEVFPMEEDLDRFPLLKVLVQIINMKNCYMPGYNFLPLKRLLEQYYKYSQEPQDRDRFFEEMFNKYLRNPVRPSDFAILLYCKNNKPQWVMEKIEKSIKPMIEKLKNDNFIATLIILTGNIVNQFGKMDGEHVISVRKWLKSLITEKQVSNIVRQSVILVMQKLPKSKKATKKNDDSIKETKASEK